MQKRVPLLIVSASCLVLGSCKDVSLGVDGVGTGGSGSGGSLLSAGGLGGGGALGTGGIGMVGGNGGSSGSATCGGTNIIANESNDYTFSSTLTMAPITVAPKSELTLDWSEVTKDFSGQVVDPKKDLNSILVLMWKLTPSAFQAKLNSDSLVQRDLTTLPLAYYPDGSTTSAKLFSFSNSGQPTPEVILSFMDTASYPITNYVYTLMAQTGTTLGEGVRMIQSFQLDPSSSNTTVKLTSDSTRLTYSVDLRSLIPTAIPAGQAAITLDWGRMTTDALGNSFVASNITRVVLGHYLQPLSVLESQFPSLLSIASQLYQGDVAVGTSVDFSSLKSSSGQGFPGIDGIGTWIIALQCGACRSPAPLYLSILKPCSN